MACGWRPSHTRTSIADGAAPVEFAPTPATSSGINGSLLRPGPGAGLTHPEPDGSKLYGTPSIDAPYK